MAVEDKELRKMSRIELIEIIYALQQNGREQDKKISELEKELENRRICVEQAGSIAEAALELNSVFASAQAAADQYLLSVGSMKEELNREKQLLLEDAGRQAEEIIAEAREKQHQIETEAEEKLAQAEASIDRMWEEFSRKMADGLTVNNVPLSALLPDQPDGEGGLEESNQD